MGDHCRTGDAVLHHVGKDLTECLHQAFCHLQAGFSSGRRIVGGIRQPASEVLIVLQFRHRLAFKLAEVHLLQVVHHREHIVRIEELRCLDAAAQR